MRNSKLLKQNTHFWISYNRLDFSFLKQNTHFGVSSDRVVFRNYQIPLAKYTLLGFLRASGFQKIADSLSKIHTSGFPMTVWFLETCDTS